MTPKELKQFILNFLLIVKMNDKKWTWFLKRNYGCYSWKFTNFKQCLTLEF